MSNSLDSFLTRIGDVTIERVAPRSTPRSNVSGGTDEVTMTSTGSNQGVQGCNDDDSEETGGETSDGETERKNLSMHRDDLRSHEEMNSEGSGDDMDLDETIDTEIGVRMDLERQQSESSCPDDDVEAVNILDTLPLEGAPIEGQEVSEADLLGKPLSKDDDTESLGMSSHPPSDPEDSDPSKRRGSPDDADPAKKKQKKDETEDSELKSEKKLSNMRRNIREVMDETQLDEATLSAQRQEMERLRRVQEQQRIIREVQRQIANHRQTSKTQPRVISLLQGKQNEMGTTISHSPSGPPQIKTPNTLLMNMHSPPHQQSSSSQPVSPRRPMSGMRWHKGRGGYHSPPQPQSQTLMSRAMSKTPVQTVLQQRIRMMTPSVSISPVVPKREPMDHVPYYSDSDMSEGELEDINQDHRKIPTPKSPKSLKGKDVVTISSSSESSDDDCIVLSDPSGGEETDTEDDPSNSGMHTNDRYNIPDEHGRVLINVGHPDTEPDVFLAPQVARIIKPHQIGGIRFLFDNIVESIERYKSSSGFGCILAHSMGLGKTLQVASFCDIFFRCTTAKTVLCIMPINTLQNWLAEFNMWLPYEDPNSVKPDVVTKKSDKCEIKEENSNQTDVSSLSSRSMSTDSRSHQDMPPNMMGQFQGYESGGNYYPETKPGETQTPIPQSQNQNFQMNQNQNQTYQMPGSYPMKQEMDCSSYPNQMYPMQNPQYPQPYQNPQYQNYQPLHDQKIPPPQNPEVPIKKEPGEPATKEEGTSTSKEDPSDEKKDPEKVTTPFSVDAPLGLEVRPRHFNLHILNDSHKTMAARARVIKEWQKVGGVLLIGYELYRQLSLKKSNKGKRKRGQQFKDTVDLEEEDKNKPLLDEMHGALVNPGPDLVICDEGHRIKNSHASISLALKQMRTKRRIVLTGYPLQNNLLEYWCMVDFVRPNYLGTKAEFCNMFERPIQNGQCIDSTPQDIRLMRYRAHVLHALLEGFVQRRSHSVLQISLPRKEEYILLVRMTPHQRKLYDTFMNQVVKTRAVPNPLKAFAVCCKIWNHPDILYHFLRKRQANEEDDLDLEETIEKTTPGNKRTKARRGERKGKKVGLVKSKPAASVQPNSSASVNDTAEESGDSKGNFSGGFQQQMPGNLINQTPQGTNSQGFGQNYQEFRPNEQSNYFRGEGTSEFNEFYNNQNQRYQQNQQFQGYPAGGNYQQNFPQGQGQGQNFVAGAESQGNQKFSNPQTPEFRDQGNNTNYEMGGMFNRGYQFQDQRNYPPGAPGAPQISQNHPPQNYQGPNQNQNPPQNQPQTQNNPPIDFNNYQNQNQNQNYQQPAGANPQIFRNDNQLNQHSYPPTGNPPPISQPPSAPGYINNQNSSGAPQAQTPMLPGGYPPGQPQGPNYPPGGQGQTPNYQQNAPQAQVFPPQPPQQHNYINNQSQNQLRYQNPQSFPAQGYPATPAPPNPQVHPQGQRYPAPQAFNQPQTPTETPNPPGNYQNPQNLQTFPPDGAPQPQNQFKGPDDRFNWQGNYQQVPQNQWDTANRYPGNYFPQNYQNSFDYQANPEVIKTEEKSVPGGNLMRPSVPTFSPKKETNVGIQTQTLPPSNYTQTPPEVSNPPRPLKSINFGSRNPSDICKDEDKDKDDILIEKEKSLDEIKSDDEVLMKDEEKDLKNSPNAKEDPGIPYDWATDLMKNYVEGLIDASAKMTLFFCILTESIRLGDRVLAFSQSLFTLNLIEDFLARNDFKNPDGSTEKWIKNSNYYRLDGSTSALEREKLINEFNVNPRIHLFLVSTRAGSLGINLVGANRAIVFDASWNPCHDTQAVCRVYRYGQKKPCYVYRLVTDNCLERKIYDRQISKQGMADRVVDQCNPDAHLSLKEATTLSWEFEEDSQVQDFSSSKDTYTDEIMHTVLEKHSSILTKQPFHHESLLVDRKDKKLSQAEKRLARRGYELEKMAANCSRPSYNYIPGNTATRAGGLQIRAIRGGDTVTPKPVASVRPMQQRGAEGLGARGVVGSRWIPAEVWQRQGMSAQEMTLPLDVVIPTNSPDKSSIVLKAGQRVMVLKSPKGIYMQLESGKIIAIRTALKLNQQKREEEPKKISSATVTSPRAQTQTHPQSIPQSQKPEVSFPLRNNSAISIIPKTPTSAPATPRPLSRPSSGSGYRQFPDKDPKRPKPVIPTPVLRNVNHMALNNQVSLQRVSKKHEMDHSAGENSNSSDSQPRTDQRVEEVRLEDIVGEAGSNSEYSPSNQRMPQHENPEDKHEEMRSFGGESKVSVQSVQTQHSEDAEKRLEPKEMRPGYGHAYQKDDDEIIIEESVRTPQHSQVQQSVVNPQVQQSVVNPQVQQSVVNPQVQSVVNPQNVQGSVQRQEMTPGKMAPMEGSHQQGTSVEDQRQSEDDPHGRMPQDYPYAEYPRYYEYPDPRARGIAAPGIYGGFYPGGVAKEPKGEERVYPQGSQAVQAPVPGPQGEGNAVKTEASAGSVPTAFGHPGGRYPAGYPPAPYEGYGQHYPAGSAGAYPPGTPGYSAYGTPSYNADYARMYSALHPPPPPVADPYMHRGYAPPPTNTPSNYYAPFPHPPPPPYPNYSYFPPYANPNIPNESQPPTQ
ncbi:uncharacterized protein LOC107045422 [Diachasma alloeum]|uniref:uncharacterized protein LOC107045422 n=1 Tax=Diachasma alloeum TaxID=454923 RepID=UPI0007382396|nr:uncharacterized protein LOC107045422 [Diachasma alloeum]